MNILLGISHPKQVHIFKNLIYELERRGHSYCVLVNEKEITSELLDSFNISYKKIGSNRNGIIQKLLQLPLLTIKTFLISLKFKPDIFIGQASPHLAYTSFIQRKPYIIFEDTESSSLLQMIVNPFANSIVTPSSFRNDLGKKQIRINGSFELAYLSQNWFKPDTSVFKKLKLEIDEIFTIVRFVGWTASHDVGHTGISKDNKTKLIKNFLKFGKVFITSETDLPAELEDYRIKINVSEMHSLLYYATLVYGESATMAAEAAHLGTPAIYLDNEGRGYTDDLSEYGLLYNFTESPDDQLTSIEKGVKILSLNNKNKWTERVNTFAAKNIDVGSFMIWFVENYPESNKMMKHNPDYQNRFK